MPWLSMGARHMQGYCGEVRTIDNVEFRRRGGFDGGNSAYAFCRTTCCEGWCVQDVEMDDLYIDGADLGKRISLLGVKGDPEVPCPFCGAGDWGLSLADDFEGLPACWLWGTRSPEEARGLGAKPV